MAQLRLRDIPHHPPPLWRDLRVLQLAGQFVFALVVVYVALQATSNILANLPGRAPDFRFWEPSNFFQQPARFEISEGPAFSSTESFGRAFVVGIVNTLRAVAVGLVLATLLGIVTGVARLSQNWLVRNLARVYVEIFQNTPLLVQLIFIYQGVYLTLPLIDDALALPGSGFQEAMLRWALVGAAAVIGVGALWYGRQLALARRGLSSQPGSVVRRQVIVALGVIALAALIALILPENAAYLSRRGLVIPAFFTTETFSTWLLFIGLAVLAAVLVWRAVRSGWRTISAVSVFLVVVAVGWTLVGAAPLRVDLPAPQIANLSDGRQVIRRINGGEALTPEYAALVTGLVLYTAAFIGEIVRAGIQAVPYGQIESARALGLTHVQTLQLVILPQALRIIVPPLGNQYLNLTKNSSLATAIGFLDMFAISKRIMHQSGQDVAMMVAVMLAYLTASLSISAVLNWLNSRLRLKER